MGFQAYIDDSGSGGNESFFVLAGFITPKEKWVKFSEDWKRELEKAPSIGYFRAFNAFHKKKQFKGWKEEDIQIRKSALLNIIKTHAQIRVSVIMERAGYDGFLKGLVPPEIDHPYFFCFYSLVYNIALNATRYNWSEPPEFIFDEQGKLGKDTMGWFSFVRKYARKEVQPYLSRPPIFRDDKIDLPLQAADLYAWALRRQRLENRLIYMPEREELKAFKGIVTLKNEIDCQKFVEAYNMREGLNHDRSRPDLPQ